VVGVRRVVWGGLVAVALWFVMVGVARADESPSSSASEQPSATASVGPVVVEAGPELAGRLDVMTYAVVGGLGLVVVLLTAVLVSSFVDRA
jgi:hypothetical protein